MYKNIHFDIRAWRWPTRKSRNLYYTLDIEEGLTKNSFGWRSVFCVEIKCQLDKTEVLYCRCYCLLNMFRAPLCPSSGAQECYTVDAACGISCCGFQVAGLVQHPANRTHNPQLHTRPTTWKPQHQIPQSAATLELLMMGIVVPETCWASNKICNKNLCCI